MSKAVAMLCLCITLTMLSSLACQDTTDTPTLTFDTNNPPATDITPPVLDSDLELKIRKDYQQYLIDMYGHPEAWLLWEIWIQIYLGNYSGCEVVFMQCHMDYTLMFRDIEIAGYIFTITTGQEAYVYSASKFYTIKEAYDAGLITRADVYNLGKFVGYGFTERYPCPIVR